MDYLQYYVMKENFSYVTTKVLNLIINGLPSILTYALITNTIIREVLNLIINGLPSIRKK